MAILNTPHILQSHAVTDSLTQLKSYVFLVSCGYMIGQVYAILTTLVTPVLSDQFGFSVEYTSYYLAAVSVAFIVASVIQ